MDCENLLLVQAEFDGELDAADALAAARHRQNCAACRDAYAGLQAGRALLRESAPRYQASENLQRAIRSGLSVTSRAAPAPFAQTRAWWRDGTSFALGAALAACIALLVVIPAQQPLLDELVASHIRALQPGHLEDVISTSEHTVKPWFDGRIDFAPPVKDLAAKQFPLLGGRLDYVGGRPVAVLVYGSDKHVIDLYVWPGAGDPSPSGATSDGYNALHWSEKGMSFWAVSDVEPARLGEFQRVWRAAG